VRELNWRGDKLYHGSRLVGEIVPDHKYSGMWRIVQSDGSLSDMCNRTRAKDACEVIFESTRGRKRGAHSPLEARTGDLAPSPDEVPA
jgi:hypothetical protein